MKFTAKVSIAKLAVTAQSAVTGPVVNVFPTSVPPHVDVTDAIW
jgi:hypothetical protein